MDCHIVTFFVLTSLFVHGCLAITAGEAANSDCLPLLPYDYLWGNGTRDAADKWMDREGPEFIAKLKDNMQSKVPDLDDDIDWLAKMNIRALQSAVNDTKARAFRFEEEGWRILGANLQWWFDYYMDRTMKDEIDHNYNYYDDPLDDIRYDLDLYGWLAFPCNSTLSTTLNDKDEYANMSLYGTVFIRNFRQKLEDTGFNGSMTWSPEATLLLKDELLEAARAANVTANATRAMIISSYMGVGWDVKCWGEFNMALEMATEWDKAASSAATTLMALIPVLLTFGNLILPRDSEAFCSSFLVGVMSAAFSLGLPGMSISAILQKWHRIDVGSFAQYRQGIISKLGRREKRTGVTRPKALYIFTFSSLQSWLNAPPDDGKLSSGQYVQGLDNSPGETDQLAGLNSFWHICHEVEKWQYRPHYWHLFGLLIFIMQLGIFIVGIGPLFLNKGTPLFMFSCHQYLSSLWMPITAATNSVFRFIMWEFSSHERVRVFPLSDRAKDSLDELIATPRHDPSGQIQGIPRSTETELPPRYHPLVRRVLRAYRSTLSNSASSFKKQYRRISRQSSSVPNVLTDLERRDEDMHSFLRWIRSQCLFFWYSWVRFPFAQPLSFIRIGFCRGDSATESARRWRPVTVLMHLSSSGRNPFSKLLTGLMEGTILLLLTIFFSAQWGGNIFVVSYTIAILLVVVTGGRLLSLLYIWQSAKTLGLHVVECQSNAQISGSLRIICSMPGVLVIVNGGYYYCGHRLDESPEWVAWRRCYDRGDYDGVLNGTQTRGHGVPATQAAPVEMRPGKFKEAFKLRRKPVSPGDGRSRHHSGGSQSIQILLRDISYNSRRSSDYSPGPGSGIPCTPEATAGYPFP